jgi:hypothetical protein
VTGRLVFASEAQAMLVAERLNWETRSDVGYLTQETGPLQLRRVIVEMGDGRLPIVVATPRWATGWRAPLGWTVEFDESFPEDVALRHQAEARVPPARGCAGCSSAA